MDAHLKLHVTQLTQTKPHPLHHLNVYSNPHRNLKVTNFYNDDHTNIIISYSNILVTPEECEENLKTHLYYHPITILLLKKKKKVTNSTHCDIYSSNKHYHLTCVH